MSASGTAPLISLTWTDPVTGRCGHLVIARLVRGVASGGLRMREGVTLDEVTGLARGMTRKEALHYDPDARYVPLGGAKGGIDCAPHAPEAYGVLTRYLRAMRPYIEQFWTTGEDLGLTQDRLDEAAAEAGLVSSIQAVYPLLDEPLPSRLCCAAGTRSARWTVPRCGPATPNCRRTPGCRRTPRCWSRRRCRTA
ncbi:hypothetical protein JCM4914_62570 [Streptomyces platensis subsp. malvinus]